MREGTPIAYGLLTKAIRKDIHTGSYLSFVWLGFSSADIELVRAG